jgi:acyl carrier protein
VSNLNIGNGVIMSVEDRVKKIVSDQLGKSMDEIQSDSSFVDDLGADSLDTVELLMRMLKKFLPLMKQLNI